MKHIALLAVAILLLTGCRDDHDHRRSDPWYLTYGNGHPIAADHSITYQEAELTNLINDHRTAAGLDLLRIHEGMEDLAEAHSIHMDLHSFLGKTNPEGDDEIDRADIAGIFYFEYTETVASGTTDPVATFDALLDTPAHDKIDDPDLTHFGVGHYIGFWTIDYARR